MRKIKSSVHVPQYETTAEIFIADESDGKTERHLIARYRDKPAPSREEFAASIPASWSEDDVRTLIEANTYFRYPLWEISAQAFGDPSLERLQPLLDAIKHIRAKKQDA